MTSAPPGPGAAVPGPARPRDGGGTDPEHRGTDPEHRGDDPATPEAGLPADAARRRPRRRVATRELLLTAAAALGAGLAVLTIGLLTGGGAPQKPAGGLPDAGRLVGWGLPVARFATDAAAMLTVGLLLVAVLLPDRKGRLIGAAGRATRLAGRVAGVWFAVTAVQFVFTVSDVAGLPLGRVMHLRLLHQFLTSFTNGRVLLIQMAVALVLTVLCASVRAATPTAFGLLLSLVALVAPAATGHSTASGNHDVAVVSLGLHLLGAGLWVGGLAAVCWIAATHRPGLATALPRYSTLAGVCLFGVAASGLGNAAVRLGSVGNLFTTSYGGLVLGKAALLTVLGVIGLQHRRRTVPAVLAGRRGAFVRLATGELVVMGAAVGLAVALSRTPTPVPRTTTGSVALDLLGYPLPGPVSGVALLTAWRLELLFAVLVAAGIYGYAVGLRRLRAKGGRWPAGRTVAWGAGLAVVVISTQSGLGTYGPVLFSVHMAQHMLLVMVAPALLAMGAPITLALRALPAHHGESRGAREWILAVVHSPVARVVMHPLVGVTLFITNTFVLYFTGLFEVAMRSHLAHLAMEVHFLAIGCIFMWPIISPDPVPVRPGHGARMLLYLITQPFHAFFGLAILSSTTVIAAGYYDLLQRPWGASSLNDQGTAGGIAWALGEPIAVAILATLFVQWVRADEREARRRDRAADMGTGVDELAAYNAYLARLAEADERAAAQPPARGRRRQ